MSDERTAGVDEALAEALRGLGRRGDPEPGELAVAAVAAYRWRTADAVPAPLSHDSLEDPPPVADPDPAAGRRRLTFEAEQLTVEVEVEAGAGRGLAGRLVPPRPAEVELRGPGGSSAATADAAGCFTVAVIPPGPLSLRIRAGRPGRPVVTDWFTP